jgi:hypothetical protein
MGNNKCGKRQFAATACLPQSPTAGGGGSVCLNITNSDLMDGILFITVMWHIK